MTEPLSPEAIKELAGLIEKKWRKVWDAYPTLKRNDSIFGLEVDSLPKRGKRVLLLLDSDDHDNARFIIWGLDRVRELERKSISLYDCSSGVEGHQYRVACVVSANVLGDGKTRAQAVARALLDALRRAGSS